MRILLTGGSGLLGTALQSLAWGMTMLAPSHAELDVTRLVKLDSYVREAQPDIILHAAAVTGVADCERQHWLPFFVNSLGTRNVAAACANRRLVYISTDYVFDGRKGMYTEDDAPHPINWYGWTKLLGEKYALRMCDDVLCIRTSFCPDDHWPHARAFVDQYTSRRPVSEIAPHILRAATKDWQGLLHIAGPRQSVYDLARSIDPDVGKIELAKVEEQVRLPRDVSLDCSRWQELEALWS